MDLATPRAFSKSIEPTTMNGRGISTMARSRDYRLILKKILEDKQSANPRFSLRAFAKQLDLTHSALNQVFKGTKNLSPETAAKISRKLKMDPIEGEHFYTLVQMENAKDPELKKQFEKKLKTMKGSRATSKMKPDEVELIPEWYHHAIIGMTTLAENLTAKNASKRLGIPEKSAQAALEALGKLGLIKADAKGVWHPTNDHLVDVTLPGKSSDAIKTHQTILAHAAKALVEQPRDERVSIISHLAFHKSRIPEARELAHEFMRKMQLLSDEAKDDGLAPDQVYAFIVNYYNVTDKA